MAEMVIFVPSRGRPQNVRRQFEAFRETGAFDDGADLVYLIDADDPEFDRYREAICSLPTYGFSGSLSHLVSPSWLPMVEKLNACAVAHAELSPIPIGFMGDDHLPRTLHWVRRYHSMLGALRTGVVSCPDGLRSDHLPTHWAMTSDIVRALGRMVPAPVEHMYSDNSVLDVSSGAECYAWLPDLLVEHMHPLAGKADPDEGYLMVNSPLQYAEDSSRYQQWRRETMPEQVEKIRELRRAHSG